MLTLTLTGAKDAAGLALIALGDRARTAWPTVDKLTKAAGLDPEVGFASVIIVAKGLTCVAEFLFFS
jgi:hypothetical protein